jgi:hypothetical protein
MTPALLLLYACLPRLAVRERAIYGAGIAACIGTLALFFKDWAFLPALDCFQFPHVRPWEYLPFSGFILLRPFTLYASASAISFQLAVATAAALGLMGVVAMATFQLLRLRGDSVFWSVVWTLAGFALLFVSITAVGRVCSWMPNASASRYVPYVLPGLLAIYIALRSGVFTPRVSTGLLAFFLAACVLKETRSITRSEARTYWTYKQGWHDCYLRRHDIAACEGEVGFSLYPTPAATHLQQKLDWLEARGYSLFQDRQRLLESARPE